MAWLDAAHQPTATAGPAALRAAGYREGRRHRHRVGLTGRCSPGRGPSRAQRLRAPVPANWSGSGASTEASRGYPRSGRMGGPNSCGGCPRPQRVPASSRCQARGTPSCQGMQGAPPPAAESTQSFLQMLKEPKLDLPGRIQPDPQPYGNCSQPGGHPKGCYQHTPGGSTCRGVEPGQTPASKPVVLDQPPRVLSILHQSMISPKHSQAGP